MNAQPLTLYLNPAGLQHDTGPYHPECPDRLRALMDLFAQAPFDKLPKIHADHAPMKSILRAHTQRYTEFIADNIPDKGLYHINNDTVLSPRSLDAALEAAGAVCRAVDDIATGKTNRAFCAVRPPGHHAEPGEAMGFCLFNNIFIGARHAQDEHGLTRIAIVDFDVHHGNGTDAMTRGAKDILYISSHEYPLYPMTGHPKDNVPGQIVNAIMAPGEGGAAFRKLYKDTLLPALAAFKPDLVMISAGFDAHKDDPLANINLGEDDFGWITNELVALANKHANGRIVSVLEGGYNLDALRVSTAVHLKALTP
jgi:acetoin utilization deacetylase AcuC-like enzyme